MSIETLGGELLIAFAILIMIGGLVAAYVWRRNRWGTPESAKVVTWVLLSFFAMAALALFAFIGIHVLLFLLGTGAAWVGVAASAILLVLTPLLLGRVILRPVHH